MMAALRKAAEDTPAGTEAPSHDGKLKRKDYEKELRKLQVELCRLQDWVKHKGLRVIIVFEGRDTAGKGGTIKALTERANQRVVRVVALPPPSERQKTQVFAQRYVEQFPAAGEVVIFDRSWYNRAGVERVMDFIDERQQAFGEIGRGWGATQSGPEACGQRCTVLVMTAPRVGCDHHLSSRSINGLCCGRFGVSSGRRLSRRIRSVSESRMMCSARERMTCLSRSPRS